MDNQKTFQSSLLTLDNRTRLSLSGVEKVYGANANKVLVKVMGADLCILGNGLTVEKLDVDTGNISLAGIVDEIKYSKSHGSLLKRIFK